MAAPAMSCNHNNVLLRSCMRQRQIIKPTVGTKYGSCRMSIWKRHQVTEAAFSHLLTATYTECHGQCQAMTTKLEGTQGCKGGSVLALTNCNLAAQEKRRRSRRRGYAKSRQTRAIQHAAHAQLHCGVQNRHSPFSIKLRRLTQSRPKQQVEPKSKVGRCPSLDRQRTDALVFCSTLSCTH